MDVLHWKQKDWAGREFKLWSVEKSLGKLLFAGWSSYDAVYTSGNSTISFTNKGWVEQEVTIRYNGEVIGTATSSVFGKTELRLLTGEKYNLKSYVFSYNRTVEDAAGNTVVSFRQPMFSLGKGEICIAHGLAEYSREVILSTSLYLKAVSEHQAAILIIIFIPIFLRNIL